MPARMRQSGGLRRMRTVNYEFADIVGLFGAVTRRTIEASFDDAEVHGSYVYLLFSRQFFSVFRPGVPTKIGNGVTSSQFNEINGLEGSR
ncbi:hypothetical protein [Bradyrhizobium genosp. P]|uniref:hypothetical protein n=1 Tax=Bradyrhizobium genosp. P TaxID=83641 RepID=UPI003CF169CF